MIAEKIRMDLHAIPEIGYCEFETKKYILSFLQNLGCKIFEVEDTGVVAFFDFGKSEAVAIRADMDALPIEEQTNLSFKSRHKGFMHACGHDGHMAMALAAAKYVNDTKNFSKNVVFVFQPAEELDGGALLRKDLGVHAIYTCTAGNYRYTRDWAKERGLVVNTHLSETRKEVDDCIREHGMRPAEYLEQLGFFDLPCYVAHGVHLSDTEAVMLAQHNVGLIHNPSSNCKLASGIAPVSRFRKLGLTVGLGTDGASSNNNLSMIKEMRLAAMISTVSTLDVGALPPYEVLKMATIDSARALRADDIIGSLEAGKRADITIINTNTANMTPVNDIFSAIVFSMSENNIDSVYINGRCVLDEGRLTTIDEDLVCREAQRCWNRLRRSE